MKNPVLFVDNLPSLKKVFSLVDSNIKQAIVICDKRFQFHPLLKTWRQNKNAKFYYLRGGEQNKNLEKLSSHINKILYLNKDFDKSSLLFISVGGGSLTDLTGFIASIYKRGLPVVHCPSTWLSALDSAHGGKTALNFKSIKNLIGSYHFPKAVIIVKNLLQLNPKKLQSSAFGELLKIVLIEGGGLYKKLKKEDNIVLENFLKPAIQAKMKIVSKDPWEKSLRKKLNLGHTIGHIYEAHYSLPHGTAILQGLLFSLKWSFYKGFINKTYFEEIKKLIPVKKINKKMSAKTFQNYLKQDKKHKKGFRLDFVFIKKPGDVFIKSVSEKDILKSAQRQGLVL